MSESLNKHPAPIHRHEKDCAACLEPQHCDCQCATCVASRLEYKKYILGMLIIEPRD